MYMYVLYSTTVSLLVVFMTAWLSLRIQIVVFMTLYNVEPMSCTTVVIDISLHDIVHVKFYVRTVTKDG